jgi:hypothetical protein
MMAREVQERNEEMNKKRDDSTSNGSSTENRYVAMA